MEKLKLLLLLLVGEVVMRVSTKQATTALQAL